MSQAPTDRMGLLDPLGLWKTARDANLEAWSKLMIDIVNSDEYAQATGLALEQALATSQPFRDALERSMTQTLGMLNMPTRTEVITLAERLVNIEMRLDDMDAKLSDMQTALQDTIKDAMRNATATQSRHIKESQAEFETSVKETLRQVLATPATHIREIQAQLKEVDAAVGKLKVQRTEPQPATRTEPKAEARAEVKPEPKPEPKAEPKPAQPTAKKEQETK
jgi:polyhydroxyalkanoic acid synthase PhaR subunit